jgi:hypothetical protein
MQSSSGPPVVEIVELGPGVGSTSSEAPISLVGTAPSVAPAPLSLPGARSAPRTPSYALPGVELLVNEKRSKTPPAGAASMAVLESLDEDLAALDKTAGPATTNVPVLKLDKQPSGGSMAPAPALSAASAQAAAKPTTWDGFEAIRPTTSSAPPSSAPTPPPSKEAVLKDKFGYLRKLEALEKQGIKVSKRYTMESSLDEMRGEYELIADERETASAVRFQAKMLMACVTGIEFMNSRFDPFDVKLDGWGETVQENIHDYDDVFGELHEKYKSKARIAPELKLLFMIGGSAVMAHMSNTMFRSAVPGVQDLLRDNPELMQQFNSAAAASMTKDSPGLQGFLSDLGGGGGPPRVTSQNRTPTVRQDMTGPRDIDDILGRLKTKERPPAAGTAVPGKRVRDIPKSPAPAPGGDGTSKALTSARKKQKSDRTAVMSLAT